MMMLKKRKKKKMKKNEWWRRKRNGLRGEEEEAEDRMEPRLMLETKVKRGVKRWSRGGVWSRTSERKH